MRVLVTERIGEQGLRILSEAAPTDVKIGLSEGQLIEIIGNYSVLVVRSQTQVSAKVIEAADSLRIVGRCGVGVDNIDVEAATRHGVLVLNSPFGNTEAAAEHTISLMLSLARNIPDAVASMRSGAWERKQFIGTEIHDKTLGVVGFGKIGSEVARRAQGLDMKVICFDPQVNVERARNMNVEVVELDDLLRRCDFLSFHVPLNTHTRKLLNGQRLELMKPTARVINCARGGIIDEAALAEALRAGRIAGAAIDVWEHEPPLDDHRSPLLDAPNVIATPHLGASTTEAQENVAVDVAKQVLAAWQGQPVQGAVNLPQLEAEEHRRLEPYFRLAEALGRFHAEIAGDARIDKVDVAYRGKLQDEPVAPLTRALLRGLLRTYHDQSVNYVNVPSVVADMGIQVRESRSTEPAPYPALMSVNVTTDRGQHVAEGYCFGQDPRIVTFDGFSFNIVPHGHLLVWWNLDQPGVIGKVGTLLGDAEVNIAGMQLGRDAIGGGAVSVVEIDNSVDDALLAKIRAIPGMMDVRRVAFGNDAPKAALVAPSPE